MSVIKIKLHRVGEVAPLVQSMCCMHKALCSTPSLHGLSMVMHVCNLNTQEVE